MAKQRPPLSPPNPFTSTSSSSILLSDAPTPNNTYSSPDAFASVTRRSRNEDVSFNGEMMYDDMAGDVSLRPSLASSSYHGLNSGIPPSFSSHTSSYLLPTPSSSSSDPMSTPRSNRPIPAPPLSLRSSHTATTNSDLRTPTTEANSLSIPSDEGRKFGEESSDLEASTSRESRPNGVKQEDVDAARLKQLGYDAVLGRDYTFWSSLSISWLNIGCIQVSSGGYFRGWS